MPITVDSSNFNKRPLWLNGINRVWQASYSLGSKVILDKDRIIKAARKETGLNRLGDFWDEPLERLISSINSEAHLHPVGRFITKKRLENLIAVRLRAEDHFAKNPDILEQELYPVTVIVGLQRTGTTKMQRMLAADPETRALLSWEALNPSPIKGDAFTGANRIKFAKMSENALRQLSPGFFAIHPVEHLAPEEDVLLLDVSFLSTTAEATMNVPSYSNWLENTDQNPAYEYESKLLKLLQWQNPAKQWVLKTPHHLEFLELVNRHFGNVQYVWMHRDIHEAIPSFLSMLAYSRSIFSNEVDAFSLAQYWVRKIGFMLEQALEFRKDNHHQFIDVRYDDFVENGIKSVKEIYEGRGSRMPGSLTDILLHHERNSPKGKYGVHNYRYSDFGIDEQFVNEQTEQYQKFIKGRFII